MQSEVYEKQDEESHRWLEPKKVESILAVQEQMVETTAWKANRGLSVGSDKYRIRRQTKKKVMHWLLGCTKLAATKF